MHLPLDISSEEGHSVILDLVRWADVVVESFSPGVMQKLGLGWDHLQQINPRLIMLSSSLLGQSGNFCSMAGIGTMGAALAGFYGSVGWPDRAPAGPWQAYSDYTSPRITASLIIAALRDREHTHTGVHIDFSQLEGAGHFLGNALADFQINGNLPTAQGNDDEIMAPHGVYPTADDSSSWIAIACRSDVEWKRLAELIGCSELGDLRSSERITKKSDIDAQVTAWTQKLRGDQVESELRSQGIPVHRAHQSMDCIHDLQLQERSHFQEVPHKKHGTAFAERCGFQLSRTPAVLKWAGPTFGQHNQEILEGILGYDDEKIADLIINGALG